MAVEITGVNTTPLSESKAGNTKTAEINGLATRRAQNDVSSSPATPTDKITITKQAEALRLIEDAVYAQTGVDSERVDSLKVEINAGRYDINVQRVAEKLIAFEAQFVA